MKQIRILMSLCSFCAVGALVLLPALGAVGATPDPSSSTPPAANAPAPATAPVPAPATAGSPPKLVIPEPTFDFGSLDNNEIVKHDFVLRNEGTGVLEIKEVRPGCSCTTAQIDNKTIQPGQEEKVVSTLKLKDKQGKLTKIIAVMTNDPATPYMNLTLTGTVTAPIMLDPQSVTIPQVLDDESRSTKFRVYANKEGLSFAIKAVEINGISFMEHETKEITPGKEYSIEVRSKGAMPTGSHIGHLLVRTDCPDIPSIFGTISVQVVGAMLVTPPTVLVGFSEKPGEKETQQIMVAPGRLKEFTLTGAVAPVEGMKADINKLSENNYSVRLVDMPKDDSLDGKELILKTDSTTSPEMRVPFKVFGIKTEAQKAAIAAAVAATNAAAAAAAPSPATPSPAAPAPAAPAPAPAPAPAAK